MKNNLKNYNITNLDINLLILILYKSFLKYQLKKDIKIKVKSSLISAFKQVIINLKHKYYND